MTTSLGLSAFQVVTRLCSDRPRLHSRPHCSMRGAHASVVGTYRGKLTALDVLRAVLKTRRAISKCAQSSHMYLRYLVLLWTSEMVTDSMPCMEQLEYHTPGGNCFNSPYLGLPLFSTAHIL